MLHHLQRHVLVNFGYHFKLTNEWNSPRGHQSFVWHSLQIYVTVLQSLFELLSSGRCYRSIKSLRLKNSLYPQLLDTKKQNTISNPMMGARWKCGCVVWFTAAMFSSSFNYYCNLFLVFISNIYYGSFYCYYCDTLAVSLYLSHVAMTISYSSLFYSWDWNTVFSRNDPFTDVCSSAIFTLVNVWMKPGLFCPLAVIVACAAWSCSEEAFQSF